VMIWRLASAQLMPARIAPDTPHRDPTFARGQVTGCGMPLRMLRALRAAFGPAHSPPGSSLSSC
jgi:hypothetical protein